MTAQVFQTGMKKPDTCASGVVIGPEQCSEFAVGLAADDQVATNQRGTLLDGRIMHVRFHFRLLRYAQEVLE